MRSHKHCRSHQSVRLRLEALEDRCLLSSYALTDLGANLIPTALNNNGQVAGEFVGMVQKRPFSGNTRDLSADPDRSRVGAGLRESLVAVLGLQFRENRVYPRSSSQ